MMIKPSTDCNTNSQVTSRDISIDVQIQNITSKTVMIYRDKTDLIKAYVSENADNIEKDNDDPMPFVRYKNFYIFYILEHYTLPL